MIDDRRAAAGRELARADETLQAAFEERRRRMQQLPSQGMTAAGFYACEGDWLRAFSRTGDPLLSRELGEEVLRLSRAEARRKLGPLPPVFDRPGQIGFRGDKETYDLYRAIFGMFGRTGFVFEEESSATAAPFLKKYEPAGAELGGDAETRFISSCSYLSPTARKVSAVTTLRREKDGSYGGYNTDYQAFHFMLHYLGMPLERESALVVSDGKPPAALPIVLREWGAYVECVTVEQLKTERSAHSGATLLIYTGKVGAYPFEGESPVNLSDHPGLKAVIDLNCRPYRTKLLLDAERRALPYMNGLPRLVARCVGSETVWNGGMEELPEERRTVDLIRQAEDRTLNLVLVGMPGSGKSTQARFLNYMLKRPVYDTDQAFRYRLHEEPGDFIRLYGEDLFRREETAVIRELGRMTGVILATGGGSVLREENQDALRQNGRIVYLSRPAESLSTFGRPLSADKQKLHQMEAARVPVYRRICDAEVPVDDNRGGTARRILRTFGMEYLAAESN